MMSTNPPTDRILSLPCFEALQMIRNYQRNYPDFSETKLLELIHKIEPDASSLDFEAAVCLSKYVGENCPQKGVQFYQTCIYAVVQNFNPDWLKSISAGRIRFWNAIDEDLKDVFRATGVMYDPPEMATIRWWDKLSEYSRSIGNLNKLSRGRTAEYYSLNYEMKRLNELKIDDIPVWTGLDDNYVGYDILSYERDTNRNIVKKFIEVKSTIQSPVRFIISKNEWEEALRKNERYIFHVWDLSKLPYHFYLISSEKILPHIPMDEGKGEWKNASIPIHGSWEKITPPPEFFDDLSF